MSNINHKHVLIETLKHIEKKFSVNFKPIIIMIEDDDEISDESLIESIKKIIDSIKCN